MASRRAVVFWVALPVTFALVFLAAALWMPRMRVLSEQAEALARLEQQNRELSARADQLTREREALLRSQEEESAVGQPGPPSRKAIGREDLSVRLEQIRLLSQTQERLAAANANVAELQARVQELETTVARITTESKTLAAAEVEWKEKLAGSARLVEAIQAELKSTTDRLVQIEIRNKSLDRENRESRQTMQKLSRTAEMLDELEGINRRREALLTGILRRYREVTDLYRTLVLSMDDPGENPPPPSAGLSRIQNAISLADEDLKQLGALNAQASRLQKRLRSP